MTRKLAFLVPSSLKRLDQHLLVNHPGLWASKVHFVLFYGLLVAAGISLMALFPMQPNDLAAPDTHFLLSVIPAGLGLLFWIWQVGKINVERFFGETSFGQRLKLQGLYALCVVVFASIPFLYGHMIGHRAAHSVSNEQLVQDINTFHLVGDLFEMEDHYYYNFEGIDELLNDDQRRLIRSKPFADEGADLTADFVRIANTYGSEPLATSTAQAIRASVFQHRAQFLDSDYQGRTGEMWDAYYSLQSHARYKSKWEGQRFFFQELSRFSNLTNERNSQAFPPVATLLVLFYGWLLSMIFMRQGMKRFWLSVATGVGVVAAGGLLIALLDTMFLFSFDDEQFIGMLYFVGMSLLALVAFLPANRKKLAFWKSAALALLTVFSPLFLFFKYLAVDQLNSDVNPWTVFSWGMLITAVLWTLVYDRQFIRQQAAPIEE